MNLLNKRKGLLAAILLLLPVTHISLHAQLTIGSANNPVAGAILDLNNGAAGGLVLSNVNIEHPEKIPTGFPGITATNETVAKAGLTGAMVYNTNNVNTCVGVHAWDGKRWERIVSGLPRKGGAALSITSDVTSLFGDEEINFEVAANAKTYTWYVNTNGAGYTYLATTIEPEFGGTFPDGSHTVKVISDNCRFLEESNEVSFAAGKVSPSFGSVAGGNYVYIYGDFEYASSSDYVQDGLVAHYDGIDNTGQGDKYHSNSATVWKDVNGNNDLTLYGTPATGGGWKSNGFYFNDTTYFNAAPVPDGWPLGADPRTVEITFITAPSGMTGSINKTLFVYGLPLSGQKFGVQYLGSDYYPLEGSGGDFVYAFTAATLPDLVATSKLNTTTSVYYGAAIRDSKIFVNGEDAPSNQFSGSGTLNTANYEVNIGRNNYLGRYATDFQVLSVRLYSKTLDRIEVQNNSEVDQRRFIAPPIVKIGDNLCSEVVVLSSHFLMCKVPESTTGAGTVNVKINSDTYTNAYKYVAATEFHISGISPIIGPAAGETITLTGNKLNEITGIEIDNVPCQILTNDGNVCTVSLPAHEEGEVDIVIITASQTYRLAKVFEYKN